MVRRAGVLTKKGRSYMASIIKRKKAYSVVYNYIDESGETKQKWKTWHTHKYHRERVFSAETACRAA